MTSSYEELARRIAKLERRASTSTPQLIHSTIESGALSVRAEGGQLTALVGEQFDGTFGSFTVAGPPPPTPIAPDVESITPGALVTIPGTWEPLPNPQGFAPTPQVAPMDFLRFEVHAATTPDFSGLLFETLKGTVESARGGPCIVPLPPDTDYWFRVVARTQSGRLGLPSLVVGPVRARKIEQRELDIDFTKFGGANLFYGPDDPTDDPDVTVGTGDLWYAEVGSGIDGAGLYESRRWDGATWKPLVDQSANQALASAIGAATLAGSKTRWVTAAVAPTPTAEEDATPDLLWWTDTADDNTIKSWRAPDWHAQRLGNGAIQPGSLVLSELAVTGSVTAALLEALMVLASTIVVGDPQGNRVTISGINDETFGIQQVVDGQVTFQLSPDGSTFFAGVLSGRSSNYQEAESGWIIGADGDAGFQNVQVFDGLTAGSVSASELFVRGVSIDELVDQSDSRVVSQGYNDQLELTGLKAETGIAMIGFKATPGQTYEICINGPEYTTSSTTTYVGFSARGTTDGSIPGVASPLIKNFGQFEGGNAPTRIFEPSPFLWTPNITQESYCYVLLTFFKTANSPDANGTIGANAKGALRRIEMYVKPAGDLLPNSVRANHSTVVAPPPPPPPPVQGYEERFYSTWTASYRTDGSRWSEGDRLYQGYGDSYNGNQASLFGLDVPRIRSLMSGARIVSARLQARAMKTWYSSGGHAWVGTHVYDAMPATYGNGPTMRLFSVAVGSGGWFEADVTALFTDIRNGSRASFMFGRAPDNDPLWYAYFYGQNHADRPYVTVKWEK